MRHIICYKICFYNNPKLNEVLSNIIDIEKNVFKVNGSSILPYYSYYYVTRNN